MSYDTSMRIDTGAEYPSEVEDIGNMTSNVSPMWTRALGYPLRDLQDKTGLECIPELERAVSHIWNPGNRAEYTAMNPKNGWGSHERAAEYLEKILAACRRHPKATLHFCC